jgi:soluble lytic murein transglycosylase-like protein
MCKRNEDGTALLLNALMTIYILCIPSALFAQRAPNELSDNVRERVFAAYDKSLNEAADAVLATSTQGMNESSSKTAIGDTASVAAGIEEKVTSPSPKAATANARLQRLLPLVEPILRNRGVPANLSAVILVESGGQESALSTRGARGLWQLMPGTARRYGLRVSEFEDERLDPQKSTDAAARYLHDLFTQFADWKLALAAYNAGEGRIGSAQLRSHVTEFDQLSMLHRLPAETAEYVPRVFAAMQSLRQPVADAATPVARGSILFAPSAP